MASWLRVVISVACATICLLVLALWIRSYRWSDDLILPLPNASHFVIHSMSGATAWYVASGLKVSGRWALESEPVAGPMQGIAWDWRDNLFNFQLSRRPVILPHWIFALLLAAAAATPWLWLKRQVSLRMILGGMTIIAIVLGAVVASAE